VRRVEKEVDKYFEELYSAFFHPTPPFPGFSPDHWSHGNSDHPF
jgi:hypothetical protein